MRIELHPARVIKCLCGVNTIVRAIEGKYDNVMCECGEVFPANYIRHLTQYYFFDCDKCGEEMYMKGKPSKVTVCSNCKAIYDVDCVV